MLFLHNTSRVEDEPYPTLLQDKGFGGFPSLAFMDADGNVLAAQGARTVAGFRRTLDRVNEYLELQRRADDGDESVAADLLIVELQLGRVGLEEAHARRKALEDPTPTQRGRIDTGLAELFQQLARRAQALYQASRWADAADAYRTLTTVEPDNSMAWFRLGYSLHALGELEDAVVAHMKAAERPGPAQTFGMYNSACAFALLGDKDKAFEWLGKAADAGYKDTAQVEADPDLEILRDDPRYKRILARMKGG